MNNPAIQEELMDLTPATATMCKTLYGIQILLNLGVSFWVAQKASKKYNGSFSVWELFQTQLSQRKFALLGNIISLILVLIRFSEGVSEYAGNLLGVSLFVVKVISSHLELIDASTIHNNQMAPLYEKMDDLISQRAALKATLNEQNNKEEIKELNEKINKIELTITKKEANWALKRYELNNRFKYYIKLTVSFSIMCCFFIPGATSLVMKILGSTLCFAFNVMNASITGKLDIARRKETHKEQLLLQKELIEKFDHSQDIEIKKHLYIDITGRLTAKSKEEKQETDFLSKQLNQQAVINSFLPTILFMSTAFMPLGLGLGVMFSSYGLIYLIKRLTGPEPLSSEPLEFNESAFNNFNPKAAIKKIDQEIERLYPKKQSKTIYKSGSRYTHFSSRDLEPAENPQDKILNNTVSLKGK